jgi:hypothetical protein
MSHKAPILVTCFFALMGFALFMTARQIEQGTRLNYQGRHAARNQALAGLAEALGTKGTLAVWLGGTALSGTWLVLAIRKRRREAAEAEDGER